MFEGEKIRLRAYTRDDLPLARSFLNDVSVAEGMSSGIPFPLRPEDEEKWYNSLDPRSDKGYSFAIETKEDNTYLGGCGINSIDAKNHCATVGIFLGSEHCERGYGTDALRVLVDFCFNEVNLNKVRLVVFSFNKRAIRCYEKVGFKTEGVLRQEMYRGGSYHDTILMGLLRSEWEQSKKSSSK